MKSTTVAITTAAVVCALLIAANLLWISSRRGRGVTGQSLHPRPTPSTTVEFVSSYDANGEQKREPSMFDWFHNKPEEGEPHGTWRQISCPLDSSSNATTTQPFLGHHCGIPVFSNSTTCLVTNEIVPGSDAPGGQRHLSSGASAMPSSHGGRCCLTVYTPKASLLLPPPACTVNNDRNSGLHVSELVGNPVTMLKAAGARVLLLGHSHMRYLVTGLCWDVGIGNETALASKSIAHGDQCFHSPKSNGFAYIRTRYEVSAADLERATSQIDRDGAPYTHVVITRGLWDQMYNVTAPVDYIESVVRSLERVHATLGTNIRIVFYLQQYGNRPRSSRSYGRPCTSLQRQRLLRALNLCAVAMYNERVPHVHRVEIFDPWDVTIGQLARQYADDWGHHYGGIVLRNIVWHLVHHIVSPSPRKACAARFLTTRLLESSEGLNATCHAIATWQREHDALRWKCLRPGFTLVDGIPQQLPL